MTNSLDYLSHVASQNSQSPVQDPEIGLEAALCLEYISGFPKFLQSMHQIQDQSDFQVPVDANLESTFAVG